MQPWWICTQLVRYFTREGGFVKKCGTNTANGESGDACLTKEDLDGSSWYSTGCWYNNSCGPTLTGSTWVGPKYRRPRMLTTGTYAMTHEADILKGSVAFVAGMIRRNAFAPPSEAKSTDAWYGKKPSYSGPGVTWDGMSARLQAIGYDVYRYYDVNMDRELLAIAPIDWQIRTHPDEQGRNWEAFIFNLQPTSYAVIEVPHPMYDLNSERMGAEGPAARSPRRFAGGPFARSPARQSSRTSKRRVSTSPIVRSRA